MIFFFLLASALVRFSFHHSVSMNLLFTRNTRRHARKTRSRRWFNFVSSTFNNLHTSNIAPTELNWTLRIESLICCGEKINLHFAFHYNADEKLKDFLSLPFFSKGDEWLMIWLAVIRAYTSQINSDVSKILHANRTRVPSNWCIWLHPCAYL